MVEVCHRPFDEARLSGYVDRELTQAEAQRVRLHLEDCPTCRHFVEEITRIKEAAMSTTFTTPGDEQWQEAPHGSLSRWLRRFGWLVVLIWLVGVSLVVVWGFAEAPAAWWEKALAVSLIGGPALLLLSVALDRLRSLKTDRYRRVEK